MEYYSKLPASDPVDVALVVDPMLATGGSATVALAALKKWGASRVKLLSVIAAPEGVAEVQTQFPDTQIFVCAIDERLNQQKFIVPGLGDAGDRTFNHASRRVAAAAYDPATTHRAVRSACNDRFGVADEFAQAEG